MVKVSYNQQYHAVCTRSSCSPAREFSLFSETAQLGWVEEVKVRKEELKWCQFTTDKAYRTAEWNHCFGWHLFTNSCTQNLLAQRASGESIFGCPTENLIVPRNRMGGNFKPCAANRLPSQGYDSASESRDWSPCLSLSRQVPHHLATRVVFHQDHGV